MGLGYNRGRGGLLYRGYRFSWERYWATHSIFYSGDLDFENLKWLDKSPNNNDATLVETGCINFINDITITLITPRVGATIIKVNESVVTTGVTISSGNIAIDQSELPNSKIWSIELSTGELFILQTMGSVFVYANGNRGSVGGTQNIDWEWSTSDSAYPYHLKNGFSKYPYYTSQYNQGLHASTPYVKAWDVWSVEWEGYCLEAALKPIFTTLLKGADNYVQYCSYNPAGQIIVGIRSEGLRQMTYTATLARKIKIKVECNGCGYANDTSWKLYVNDVEVTPVFSAAGGTADRAYYNCWSGNGRYAGATNLIRNFKVVYNDTVYQLIKDGITADQLFVDRPLIYQYIPVFDGVDAVGFAPTNPAYENEWNYPETKLKMPVNALLFANDVNGILYTDADTPNSLNLEQFYPSFGGKIHCNNGTDKRLKDLIVTKTVEDFYSHLNGFNPEILLASIRADGTGSLDARQDKYDDLAIEENIKVDLHTGQPVFTGNWATLVASKQMATAIHDVNPAFYKYATYSEGLMAYNVSTVGEKTAGTVIENQGKIGYTFGEYDSPLEDFAFYVLNYGFEYPDGITPDRDDDNSIWWQWWLDQWRIFIESKGGSIASFSEPGALPVGIHQIHPDFSRMIEETIYGDISGVDLSDDLENDISIFNASKNASIVEDGGDKCQKLTGTGDNAYGRIDLGSDDWYLHNVIDVSFDIKSDGALPLTGILFLQNHASVNITFAANVTFLGTAVTNVCEVDTWYRIRLNWNSSYYRLFIYDLDGACILTTRQVYVSGYPEKNLALYISGSDCLIKNVSIKTARGDNREIYCNKLNHAKYDDDTEAYTADQWIDLIKKSLLTCILAGKIGTIFSHYVKDPAEKAADGTFDGVMDRSYLKITEAVQWLKANGVRFTNSYEINHNDFRQIDSRRNRFPNGDFETDLFGYTTSVWGYNSMSFSAGETASSSIDGTNIVELAGATAEMFFRIKNAGSKYLKFWAKGNFNVIIKVRGKTTPTYTQTFVPVAYTYYKLPIFIEENDTMISITFVKIGTTYLHKLCLDDI